MPYQWDHEKMRELIYHRTPHGELKPIPKYKLAVELGVAPDSLYRWMKGQHIPPVTIVTHLANRYQVPITYFFKVS